MYLVLKLGSVFYGYIFLVSTDSDGESYLFNLSCFSFFAFGCICPTKKGLYPLSRLNYRLTDRIDTVGSHMF